MTSPAPTLTELLPGKIAKRLLKKGSAIFFWQVTTVLLTFASTIWIARCLGPLELGRSGFIVVTGSQILLLISVCPNTYAIRITKNATNVQESIGIVLTSRAMISVVYLVVMLFVFMFGWIPEDWKVLVVLGFAIPVFMAFQPIWLFQALEKQTIHFKVGAIVAFCIFIYAAIFIRNQGTGIEEVTARLVAQFAGLGAGWLLIGYGNFLSYVRVRYVKLALRNVWQSRTLFGTQIVIYIIVGLELPLIAYLIDVEQLGMYRTATQLALGINTFIAILPMLYYPRFIEWQKISSEFLWERQRAMFLIALGFVLPSLLLTLLVGPYIFTYIFGISFKAAGLPFAILVCSKLVVMLGNIFSWGLWAKSKDLSNLVVFSVVGLITFFSNLILIPIFGVLSAACINLFGQICILILTYFIARKEVKSPASINHV